MIDTEYGTTPVFFKCNFQKKTFDIEVGAVSYPFQTYGFTVTSQLPGG